MRSSRRRRDEEGRCKEAERGGPGIKRHKGRRRRRKRRPCNKKQKKKKKDANAENRDPCREACNDRDPIREHTFVILHAIYPSGTFSAEKGCFLLKIKSPRNRTLFFVFSSSPLSFSRSFFLFFLFQRNRWK